MATKQNYIERHCLKCGEKVPTTKRSDAVYCSDKCRAAAEKKRYKDTHPEYVERQLRLVSEIRHKKLFGHTDYLDNPILNPKDKYRVARSLGFRSLLEYTVAKQLESLGVPFTYEETKIKYRRPSLVKKDFEELSEWLENNPNVELVLVKDLEAA